MTTTTEPTWVREFVNGAEYIEHLDGVPWHEAPLPRRFHRCKAQTRGWLLGKTAATTGYLERCACGATKLDHEWAMWFGKNETRKARRRRRG